MRRVLPFVIPPMAVATGAMLLMMLLLSAFAPRPKKPTVRVSRYRTASVVWVKWTVTGTSGLDSMTIDVTNGATRVHRRYLAASKTDSVSFPAPAPAQSIGGTVTALSWRRTMSSTPVSLPWSYLEPDVPPPAPTLDSILVRPASVELQPGQSQQFCPVLCYSSGGCTMPQRYGVIPTCAEEYSRLGAAVVLVTEAEQAAADAACIVWRATGGAIELEPCDDLRSS